MNSGNDYKEIAVYDKISIDNTIFMTSVSLFAENAVSNITLPMLLHTHSYSEIFICLEGELWISQENGSLMLEPGDLALIPSGQLHIKQLPRRHGVWLGIGVSYVNNNRKDCSDLFDTLDALNSQKKILILRQHSCIYNLAQLLAERYMIKSAFSGLTIVNILLEIAGAIEKSNVLDESCEQRIQKDDRMQREDLLDQIINGCYADNLTVKEVADRLFISPRQLARIVDRRYGMTLHHIVMAKRISAAEDLLRQGELSVETIGILVGFKSKSSFYREFHRKHALTPAQYRVYLQKETTDQ